MDSEKIAILTYKNPDLHMHSTYSDGTDTPEQLLANVRAVGLDIFALTDHDCIAGCAAMSALIGPGDPVFIPGVEFSCKDEQGRKFHILGYHYDPDGKTINEAVDFTHEMRRRKTVMRFEVLKEQFKASFTEEEIAETLALENPGRPHFVDLLMKHGYVKERKEGFDYMAQCHVKVPSLTPEQGIHAILGSGGIPVLAHGILADGSENLTEEEITERVRILLPMGLKGLECYYSTFTPEQKGIMLKLADTYHLAVTAGSDYHGSHKIVKLGETNDPDADRMRKFYSLL